MWITLPSIRCTVCVCGSGDFWTTWFIIIFGCLLAVYKTMRQEGETSGQTENKRLPPPFAPFLLSIINIELSVCPRRPRNNKFPGIKSVDDLTPLLLPIGRRKVNYNPLGSSLLERFLLLFLSPVEKHQQQQLKEECEMLRNKSPPLFMQRMRHSSETLADDSSPTIIRGERLCNHFGCLNIGC